MDRLVVRLSQGKSLLVTAVLIGGGLFILALVSESSSSPMVWIMVLLMLIVGAYQLFKGFDRSAKIIMDDEGIQFPGLKIDPVSWDDIADAYVEERYSRHGPRYFVHIDLEDRERKNRRREDEQSEGIVFQADYYELEAQDIVDAILRKRSGLPFTPEPGEELAEEGA